MHRRLRSLLQAANLRDEEIALYLSLLKQRKASVAELKDKAHLSTATAYRTIQRLEDRGLVKATAVNDKQALYEPLSLQALSNALEADQRKLRRLQLSLQDMDSFLPYLETADSADTEESVEVIDGKENYFEYYMSLVDRVEQEACCIGSMDACLGAIDKPFDCPEERWLIRERMKRGWYARLLHVNDGCCQALMERDSREYRTTRACDSLPIQDNLLLIAENHVDLFDCNPEFPRVIVMRQPELIDMYQQQFANMWEKASVS